ncbi:hypothetical protein PR202_gb25670 [Eleusine coracana subsp. coracana]|uniref:Uncharacterized protein n=1 Tax=Eleusine coracana subsp. coracana TaxID=191504 RepID=A0AAV5FM26_ELECO|nr:hypothetical protein PR202_gb25670 [Eleusine coracana subsp. coracana]
MCGGGLACLHSTFQGRALAGGDGVELLGGLGDLAFSLGGLGEGNVARLLALDTLGFSNGQTLLVAAIEAVGDGGEVPAIKRGTSKGRAHVGSGQRKRKNRGKDPNSWYHESNMAGKNRLIIMCKAPDTYIGKDL